MALASTSALAGCGLYKRFVCLFGDCALANTILGMQHLLYCNPPCCMLQSILRSIRFPPGPPVLPFNTQYRESKYCVRDSAGLGT